MSVETSIIVGAAAFISIVSSPLWVTTVCEALSDEHKHWLKSRQQNHDDRREREKLALEREMAAEQHIRTNVVAQLASINARLDAIERSLPQ